MPDMMRTLLISLTVAAIGCAASTITYAEDAHGGPILVELFTSEGCSSCPPADAWLRAIDASQPLPEQLIVLSEHVDYWNHDGWKDPYSSHPLTERQSDYEGILHEDSPYTPQVIVDGTSQAKLGDANEVRQVFEKSAASPKIPVNINSVSIGPGVFECMSTLMAAPRHAMRMCTLPSLSITQSHRFCAEKTAVGTCFTLPLWWISRR